MLGFFKGVVARVLRIVLPHDSRDNSAYWRGRADAEGSAAVLWRNPEFNRLVREREYEQIRPVLASLPAGAAVLDIGCGIGEMTRWLLAQRPDLRLTGVDFPEMVARAAREVPASPNLEWVASSADAFERPAAFDLVLSSACYSAIRDRSRCVAAIAAGSRAVRPGGWLLMIDPFHRAKYLARARIGADEVVTLVQSAGLVLQRSGGILFWPLREMLSNSRASEAFIARWFARGERWLGLLGEERWSDYKVLLFHKP